MATRNMTPRGFLSKCNSKAAASAAAFIAKHREYLVSGELSDVLRPIVERLDSGELYPTPALSEIRQAVADHIIASEAAKAARKLERAESNGGSSKPFEATIINARGEVQYAPDSKGEMKPLVKRFDKPQEAQRWADRRLFDGAPDWIATVTHNGAMWEDIERDESIARILRKPLPTVCKRNRKSGTLSWGMKIREKKATFSHG